MNRDEAQRCPRCSRPVRRAVGRAPATPDRPRVVTVRVEVITHALYLRLAGGRFSAVIIVTVVLLITIHYF